MDETTEQLLARLEQATSRKLTDAETPDSGALASPDDETAMLRESWLALGKLLEAADAESRSVVRLQPTPRAGSPLRLIAALAASALVAVAAWTIMNRGTDSINPRQELAVPNELPGPAPVTADVVEAPQGGDSADIVEEFAWEDSFDEQLAATSQAIRSVQANWNGGDRRYSVLLDQLEQFNEELSEGSL